MRKSLKIIMSKKIFAGATLLTFMLTIAGPVGALTIEELQAQIAALQAQLLAYQDQLTSLQGGTTTGGTAYQGIPDGFTFTKTIKTGSYDQEVVYLKAVLDVEVPDHAAWTGSQYYGPKTKAAVIVFQEKYATDVLAPWGLTSGTGFVGSTTRAKLNELLATQPSTPTGCGDYTTETDCTGGGCFWYDDACHATAEPSAPVSGLTVSLDPSTAPAVVLADGTAFNSVLSVKLTAGIEGAVTVETIKITKAGLVANTNISSVDLVDSSGTRLANVIYSVASDNTITFTLSTPLEIAAGSSVVLTVRVSLGTSITSGTLQVGIASNDHITLDDSATVTGAPVWGNVMSLSDGSSVVATVYLDARAVNASGVTLNVNETSSQEIAKFNVSEYSSKENIEIRRWVLYNNGNASDADYKDVELVAQDGTVLATAQPNGQYVTFDLSASPYVIEKGLNRNFTIRAKIIGGSSRTIQFITYNDYDIVVFGVTSGAQILVTANSGGTDTAIPIGDATNYNKVTIGSGTLSLYKAADSPTAGVAAGAQDVTFGKWAVVANGEPMELRTMTLLITDGAGATNLVGDVYIKLNGSTIGSTAYTNVKDTTATVTLSTYPTITAGETYYITVTGNVSSSAGTTDSYAPTLDITSVKRLITNDLVDPTVTATAANTISILGLSLSVKTLTIPPASSVVPGTTDYVFAYIDLDASSSGEDIKVSSIIVVDTLASGTTGALFSDITRMRLYNTADPSTAISTTSNTNTISGTPSNGGSANGTVTFTFTTPITVAKNTVIHLVLKGDVVAKSDSGTESHTFFVNNAASQVVATGADTGTQLTVAGSTLTISGSGQAQSLASAGTLLLTVLSGTGQSVAKNQLVSLGTTGQTYFAFKATAITEAQKVTSLQLTASGTGLVTNDLANIGLYADNGGVPAATPFKTASQMTCSSNTCTYTWTDTDNIFPSAIQPGSPQTFYVKADVSGENVVKLGDDFKFSIPAATDFTAVGAYTGGNSTESGTPTAPGISYIVPFSVEVTGVSPTFGSSANKTILAGTTIGQFKVTNHGSAQITLTNAKFTDNGSHTGTATRYTVYASSENSSDYTTNTLEASSTDSLDFAALTNSVTINGGAYRYITVQVSTVGSVTTGDSFNLSIASLGDFKYSVTEANLGYDAEADADLTGTITGLYVDGTPTLGTYTAL